MNKEFSVVTDTATVTVFDIQAIKHRITDTADWWSITSDELKEVNAGNIAFLGLGQDGKYNIRLVGSLTDPDGSTNLHCPSGQIFLGAGEDTTGGDLEPDGSDAIQGLTVELAPGNYQLKFKKEDNLITLSFSFPAEYENSFTQSIRV